MAYRFGQLHSLSIHVYTSTPVSALHVLWPVWRHTEHVLNISVTLKGYCPILINYSTSWHGWWMKDHVGDTVFKALLPLFFWPIDFSLLKKKSQFSDCPRMMSTVSKPISFCSWLTHPMHHGRADLPASPWEAKNPVGSPWGVMVTALSLKEWVIRKPHSHCTSEKLGKEPESL